MPVQLVPRKLPYVGLQEGEIAELQSRYGKNEFATEGKGDLWQAVLNMLKEPMFLMLMLACLLYFLLGVPQEGGLMLAALFFVGAISLYQEVKSAHALKALKQYTQPKVMVVRDGAEKWIATEDLLPGDVMKLEEGGLIPADARILDSNDLSVNESIITGESVPMSKSAAENFNQLFQGTTINSGKCYAQVTAIGGSTVLGGLGKSLSSIAPAKTLLQHQIGRFVKVMAIVGMLFFALVWLLNFLHSGGVLESLLLALTLAMAIVPEEIPVAFSSFMALGAFHMARLGIITRNPLTIENLGAVSVVCLDKTGTITENRMQVKILYDASQDVLEELRENYSIKNSSVLTTARLASEWEPFDAMEKAIVQAHHHYGGMEQPHPEMVYEYPLSGQPPMMTHVYRLKENLLVVAKGAPERILKVCQVDQDLVSKMHQLMHRLASQGYRVLGVCSALFRGKDYPESQDDFAWNFQGFIALYDPPKKGVDKEFESWYQAGISVKLVTGDYKETALNIARQVGMKVEGGVLSGEEVLRFHEAELQEAVHNHTIFARMFPEAKLRLVEALKARGDIVAMMGDGVNDGPALRSAHIGIAMGGKGTEIARQAADLILTDDDLAKVTEAIQQGRKIYHNLKKAIRYIISIHIPIIFTASLPLILRWAYPNIFTPIHVIFLELIMGPTCSIFFEREPVEEGLMTHPPRRRSYSMFSVQEILFSALQGLIIALGVLSLYYVYMEKGYPLSYVRAMVFLTIIFSNIFLTFVNRSFEQSIFRTFHYKNELAKYVVLFSLAFIALITLVPWARGLFQLARISLIHIGWCLAVGVFVTLWVEGYKGMVRKSG